MIHRTPLVKTRTTTATETIVLPKDIGMYATDVLFKLTVYASSGDTDTLDLTIQHAYDKDHVAPGWDEFVAFAQVAGTASANHVVLAGWGRGTVETESRTPNTSLAAGNAVQGPIFPDWRVVATIGNNDDPSFTWSLDMAYWYHRA